MRLFNRLTLPRSFIAYPNLQRRLLLPHKVHKHPHTLPTTFPMVITRSRSSATANPATTQTRAASAKQITPKQHSDEEKPKGKSKGKRQSQRDGPGSRRKVKRAASSDVISDGPYRDPPKDWEVVYDLFVELRKDRTAPVDDNGSEALIPEGPHHAYQTVIALMLSSQTKDLTLGKVMQRMIASGLTMQRIMDMSQDDVEKMIYGVGFHRNKAKYIKRTTEILMTKHAGKVPQTLTDLLALPGIGPKMAIIILKVAFDIQVGVSVDTHVHRISRQLGWAKNCKTPEHTRRELESWLPKEKWGEINPLLVGVGQEVQTERVKLVRKCLDIDAPERRKLALSTVRKLGVDTAKVLKIIEKEDSSTTE